MRDYTYTDEQIVHILNHSPQKGMVLLVEAYTGLIWKVISFHLANPEDIKECTNDTFAEFYFRRASFDTQKASLAVYLTAIARHLAVSRYRKERIRRGEALEGEIACTDKELEIAEIKADLARAMELLKPNELSIIQLKYYRGMTIQEIADSLNLPYETVKKRHQRSLLKLRHALLLILLLVMLIAMTVCAYTVLRHFDLVPDVLGLINTEIPDDTPDDTPSRGSTRPPHPEFPLADFQADASVDSQSISAETADTLKAQAADKNESLLPLPSGYSYVPGYGIREDAGTPIYKLGASGYAEDDETTLTVIGASLVDKKLIVKVLIYSKTKPFCNGPEGGPDGSLKIDDYAAANANFRELFYRGEVITSSGTNYCKNFDRYSEIREYTADDFEPDAADAECIPLTVSVYNLSVSFTMVPDSDEAIAGNYLYQMKDYGGLMIVPRLEDGSLIIAIHPLSNGEYKTLPGLIWGPHAEHIEGDAVTVYGADGNTLTGECLWYSPASNATYFEWNFGSAAPGSYTLHIPYVYQIYTSQGEVVIPVNMEERTWNQTGYPIPGGRIYVTDCSEPYDLPLDSEEYHLYNSLIAADVDYEQVNLENCNPGNYLYRDITFSYVSDDETHPIADARPSAKCERAIQDGRSYQLIDEDPISEDILTGFVRKRLGIRKIYADPASVQYHLLYGTDSQTLTNVFYRWNESFDFTFTVE